MASSSLPKTVNTHLGDLEDGRLGPGPRGRLGMKPILPQASWHQQELSSYGSSPTEMSFTDPRYRETEPAYLGTGAFPQRPLF